MGEQGRPSHGKNNWLKDRKQKTGIYGQVLQWQEETMDFHKVCARMPGPVLSTYSKDDLESTRLFAVVRMRCLWRTVDNTVWDGQYNGKWHLGSGVGVGLGGTQRKAISVSHKNNRLWADHYHFRKKMLLWQITLMLLWHGTVTLMLFGVGKKQRTE